MRMYLRIIIGPRERLRAFDVTDVKTNAVLVASGVEEHPLILEKLRTTRRNLPKY